MTRIDFYVLPDDCEAQRVDMVCKLAEKAVKQLKKVFIHTDDEQTAHSIDKALWHFRDDAFVPHRTLIGTTNSNSADGNTNGDMSKADADNGASDHSTEVVEIGFGCVPSSAHTVLINLSEQVPPFFSRFERTLEVVNQHESIRSSGRSRYSFYQQRGYPLQHYKL